MNIHVGERRTERVRHGDAVAGRVLDRAARTVTTHGVGAVSFYHQRAAGAGVIQNDSARRSAGAGAGRDALEFQIVRADRVCNIQRGPGRRRQSVDLRTGCRRITGIVVADIDRAAAGRSEGGVRAAAYGQTAVEGDGRARVAVEIDALNRVVHRVGEGDHAARVTGHVHGISTGSVI